MFEVVTFAGSRQRSIGLDTRAGNHVENEQSLPPDHQTVALYNRVLEKHPAWVARKACCGTYNCFGHVWASRRTCVFESDEVWRILREDDYRQIVVSEADRGDVVVYLHSDGLTIWHAGILEFREIYGSGGRAVPWVLSKVDASKGEVLHPIDDVHASFEYETQIWTDRHQR